LPVTMDPHCDVREVGDSVAGVPGRERGSEDRRLSSGLGTFDDNRIADQTHSVDHGSRVFSGAVDCPGTDTRMK